KEATARSSALGGCYRDDPPSFERNTVRAFLAASGREKLGFPWHGRQPVRPLLMLETFGLPDRDRVDLPHVLLSARESRIDEGSGCPRSAACPFDSDLQPWSSKSCREENGRPHPRRPEKVVRTRRTIGRSTWLMHR